MMYFSVVFPSFLNGHVWREANTVTRHWQINVLLVINRKRDIYRLRTVECANAVSLPRYEV